MKLFYNTFYIAVCLFLFVPLFVQAQQAEAKKPLIAVMVCQEGDENIYDAYNNMPKLMQELGEANNWEIAVLKSGKFADFTGLEILERTDVLVVYVRRIGLPKEQMDMLKKYVKEAGKGLVAVRTACHGFAPKNLPENCADWQEFDNEVLGGSYSGHGQNGIGSEVWNVKEKEKTPILKDVKPSVWHSSSSVYYNTPVAEDAEIFQYAGSTEKGKMPLTWTRMYGKTKVAYTALGHVDDFQHPAFRTLMQNLVRWAAEK